jgi:hypothetical protein
MLSKLNVWSTAQRQTFISWWFIRKGFKRGHLRRATKINNIEHLAVNKSRIQCRIHAVNTNLFSETEVLGEITPSKPHCSSRMTWT